MASRLVKECIHGDVLVILPDAVPWLYSIDSAALYTSEQLLTIARRHSPFVTKPNQFPQPAIKALLTTLLSSTFLPEFQAQHDHANCGDSCRHLSYLPRHSALFKPRKGTTSISNASEVAIEKAPAQPLPLQQSKQDSQMAIPTDSPACATAPANSLFRTLSGESTTTIVFKSTLGVSMPLLEVTSPVSLRHTPKRQSVVDYSCTAAGVHLCWHVTSLLALNY